MVDALVASPDQSDADCTRIRELARDGVVTIADLHFIEDADRQVYDLLYP